MLDRFRLEPTTASAVKVGDRFGRLTVLATGKIPDTYRYKAVCRCNCGGDPFAVRFDALLSGQTQSCGCLQRDNSRTHGLSRSPHYTRWRHMMGRCYDPKNQAYPDYGGRGIKVCERWQDLATFIEEVPPGYFPGAEMDRIDNDGDYEPGNVRWITRKGNTDNRRSGHRLTYRRRTQSLTRWAEETGINLGTLWTRLNEFGWSPKAALTTPVRPHERMLTWRGRTQSVSAWAREIGLPISTVMNRVQSGWSDEEALTAPRYAQPKQRSSATRYEFDGEPHTIREIADKTGISQKLLRKRIQERHWSVGKATKDRKDT